MNWTYFIPTVTGSRWANSRTSAFDPEWPRIGVYCWDRGHENTLWPIGSFVESPAVREQLGTQYWGWEPSYPTGSERLIRLGFEKEDAGYDSRELIGNTLRDRDTEEKLNSARIAELEAAMDAGEDLTEVLARHAEALERAEVETSQVRLKANLKCRAPLDNPVARKRGQRCASELPLRLERLGVVLSERWESGVREISLRDLSARVGARA